MDNAVNAGVRAGEVMHRLRDFFRSGAVRREPIAVAEFVEYIVTAHADVASARAMLKNGAFDFLEKPIDDNLLTATLWKCTTARHG